MVMTQDIVQSSYNKFITFPSTSYNLIKYLMDNEEQLWKILKYNDPNAWNKPNLTHDEKASLIYLGQANETDFRVFMDLGQDNAWLIEACTLRIAPLNLNPQNYVFGHLSIGFEIYSHYKINTMDNYTTRIDYGTQRIIEVFNGADIDGIGRLYFDYKASSSARSVVIGSIPFKGRATVMCNYNLG
jgi:hypothetical protein